MKLVDLLKTGCQAGATDIHIQVGAPATFRVMGQMVAAKGAPADEAVVTALAREVLPEELFNKLKQTPVVEHMHTSVGVRVRASVFHQRGTVAMVLRLLAAQDLSFDALHLPKELARPVQVDRGLVIIGGSGGSGKTTTVAAIVNLINATAPRKIVTIEELVEYSHANQKGLVSQIQIGRDADTQADALRYAVRQDPDVIVISEVVTFEDLRLALNAADTGKLVVTTMLSGDVIQTLERIHALIPPNERELTMSQLSANFQAICAMKLTRGKDRKTLYPATELLCRSPGTLRTIAEARFLPLNQLMEAEAGMHRFDDSIAAACKAGYIGENEGKRCASTPESFEMKMRGFGSTAKG